MTRSFPIIPILLVVAVILLALAPSLAAGIAQVEPVEFQDGVALASEGVVDIYGSHAWDQHGEEGIAALRCLENKGKPDLIFREPKNGPVHLLCLGDDGKWYDVIVEMLKKGKMELKSAFSPKNTSPNQADAMWKWLQDKGATRWKGGPGTIQFRWNTPKPW